MNRKLHLLFIALFTFLQGHPQSTNPDNTFGTAGKSTFSFGPNDSMLTNIALQADGKIIACGRYYYLQPGDIMDDAAICRFNADGSIDENFGNQGKIMLPGGPYSEFISTDMKILDDGKILILGYTLTYNNPNSSTDPEIIVLKYNPNGTPDAAFGNNGFLQVNPGLGNNSGNVLLVQSDNKIVIGGNIEGDGYNFAVFRLNADGTEDTQFGNNGLVSINLGTPDNSADISADNITDIQLLANGKMIVGGSTKRSVAHNYDTMFALLCLNPDGSLDTGFGINGRVFTNFGTFGDEMQSLHVLADQKIIAVGTDATQSLLSKKIIIAKYNADGSLDTTYGQGGKVIFTNGISNPRFSALSSLINANGELVIGGTGNTAPLSNFQKPILMRFTPDGIPDTGFAPNGIYTEDFNFYPADILLQPDGKLLLGGTAYNDSNIREFGVFRYESELLGSAAFANATDFSVSPNPFKNYIDIRLGFLPNKSLTVDLSDMCGRKIASLVSDRQLSEQQNTIRLDLPESLPKGTYLLKINDGKNVTVTKILK
jgi:uncharacterized delta-60 repeat protein